MKNVLTSIKSELKSMNNDIDFIKGASVYLYLIIACSAMLVGLVIGLRN